MRTDSSTTILHSTGQTEVNEITTMHQKQSTKFIRTYLSHSKAMTSTAQTTICRLESEDSTKDHRAGLPQLTPSFRGTC